MAKTRTCYICGNKYSYCPMCERDKMKPTWYFVFCGETCKDLNDIISANTAKRMTDKEAKELLQSIDLSQIQIRNNDTKTRIEELLNYEDNEDEEIDTTIEDE